MFLWRRKNIIMRTLSSFLLLDQAAIIFFSKLGALFAVIMASISSQVTTAPRPPYQKIVAARFGEIYVRTTLSL